MTIKEKTRIVSQAPTRIDLAGGTIDIWPIYLFLEDPTTINLGISLFAEAVLELTPKTHSNDPSRVTLKSADQSNELTLSWDQVMGQFSPPPTLALHYKLLKHFASLHLKQGVSKIDYDLKLSTSAKSPAGAGLGGSSTLSIAIVGALAAWTNPDTPLTPVDTEAHGEDFIEIVRDVETTVIQVPAGMQDYYGAMFGSLQSLKWGPATHQRKKLPTDLLNELEDRILLFYSGQSRNSGINNWVLFKNFIDRTGEVRSQFSKISKATQQLEQALLDRNWEAVGNAIASEWEVRKTLASGITTPEIDRAFQAARKLAPVSGKACGAGGGGCFFIYLPTQNPNERSHLKQEIQKIFNQEGIRPLPFKAIPHGLHVQVSRG